MPATEAGNPSIATTPLELLGSHAGLNVVDPGTILTRLWYFDGKFLRAAGFRLDQEYMRSLVALSNQATGTGIVHGFDVARANGDRLRIEGGLALAPSGRVVYLPQRVELSIAELIARSTGTFDPSATSEPGVADFQRCPPDAPAGPDVTVPARPLYVLTVAGIEALCGEEERFGQLCEDACATETDRSKVVEGVCFRVRELTLTLPASTAVPFGNQHLRSRVASAFFELERKAVPSMISGAGLRNPVWCAAAEGIGGEEVALAVFDRSGSVTTFVDGWTARRELMEPTPRRYWAWRMAMRPWDVFLAQVLQFQCQLLDLGDGGGGIVDPCAGERDTLVAVEQVLKDLAAGSDKVGVAHAAGAVGFLPPDAFSRVEAVRAKIRAVLGTRTLPASGSLLVDGGIVEVPAAGYLPTSMEGDVTEQVRALFGPGVDLRFCAVRPDFVPEALLEAQHMERISLTRGVDDPADREEVDVLVPGGEIVDAPGARAAALVGVVRIHPRIGRTPDGPREGSALSLSAVARDSSAAGWSCSLAAYGEAAQQLSVPDLMRGTLRQTRQAFVGADRAEEGEDGERSEPTDVFIRPDAEHDRIRVAASFTQRLRREARNAAARKARLTARATPFAGPANLGIEPDRPLADDEDRPVAVWLDAETAARLDTVPVGGMTDARVRACLYSRAATNPVLTDVRVTGTLRVVDVVTLGNRRIIRTVLDGVADLFEAGDTRPRLAPIRAFPLTWAIGSVSTGTRVLAVAVGDPFVATVTFTDAGDPRHIVGEAALRATSGPGIATPDWQPRAGVAEPAFGAEGSGSTPLASLELDEEDGALLPGATARTLAESVISIIGAELTLPGRDPAFVAYATDRMLGGLGGASSRQVRATKDWVLFHRRRTRVCAGDVVERPVRTRTYRLFHRKLADGDFGRFEALRGGWARSAEEVAGIDPDKLSERARQTLRAGRDIGFVRTNVVVDQLGFEPVATLEFPEGMVELRTPASVLRTSWRAADRGTRLRLAAVGDLGEGDGETVALGRLATVRSVLGDLVDSSQARLEYLLEIPPEFREPGLDGVMFTVGFDEVTRTCVTIYRLSREEHSRVLQRLREVGEADDIPSIINAADATADVFTAHFENDQVVDPEALRAPWNDFRVLFGVLGLPSSATGDEVAAWRNRAVQAGEVIGLTAVADEHLPAQTGECGAVLLVAAEQIIG